MRPRTRPELDSTDRRILDLLQQSGRITNVKLAAEVGLSPPSVLERVRKLEEQGVIQRYVALLDAERIDCGFVAFVHVSLALHRQATIDSFLDAVMRLPQVLECHHVAGADDYLLKVVARDIRSYRELLVHQLTRIDGVQRVNTMIVLETLKRETRLPIEEAGPEPA